MVTHKPLASLNNLFIKKEKYNLQIVTFTKHYVVFEVSFFVVNHVLLFFCIAVYQF